MNRNKLSNGLILGFASFFLLLFIVIYIFVLSAQKSKGKSEVLVSPTILPGQSPKNGRYSIPNQNYTYQVPPELSPVQSQSLVSSFTFIEAGSSYRFQVSPPGDQSLEFGDPSITVTSQDVVYGGKHFVQKTWSSQNKPFLMHATSMDQDSFYQYDFSIQLPPTNTEKYIQLFERTLSSLRNSSPISQ